MSQPICTVCALFYGDYPKLMQRCLGQLVRLSPHMFRLRLGANALSPASSDVFWSLTARARPGLVEMQDLDSDNRKKYPVMRNLFRAVPLQTPWVMWFDDDSGVAADVDPTDRLCKAVSHAIQEKADVMGSVWSQPVSEAQREWIKLQAWYGGKEPQPKVNFCTGGWWLARAEVLRKYDWPPEDFLHRGGDVMFGELCRQQGLRMVNCPDKSGLLINADDDGRECRSKKRGFNSFPIGHARANEPRPVTDP